jgi:purine-binding chemotaxis protein CheW
MTATARHATSTGDLQAIVFALGSESYGIEIAFVHEIIRRQPLTPVPAAPPSVLGLINLRSRIIQVLSLRTIFGLPEAVTTPAERIVIVGFGESRLGLLVDEVSEVRTFGADSIQPAPTFTSGRGPEHIVGIAQTPAGLVILLDIEAAVGSVDLARAG